MEIERVIDTRARIVGNQLHVQLCGTRNGGSEVEEPRARIVSARCGETGNDFRAAEAHPDHDAASIAGSAIHLNDREAALGPDAPSRKLVQIRGAEQQPLLHEEPGAPSLSPERRVLSVVLAFQFVEMVERFRCE